MKKLTTLLLALVATFTITASQAQEFSFSPSGYIIDDVELEHYKNFQVDILHPQVDDLTLVWVTIENNLLEKWEYTSCDNGGCYSAIPDTGVIEALPDTVPGYIRLTINPRDQAGTATVKFYIYNIKYPDEGQYVSFEITAMEVTAIAAVSTEKFRIYPNPASDFIQVHNADTENATFQLIDMTGKVTLDGQIGAGENLKLDLGNISPGLYFANYRNTKGITTEKLIIK
jgi:hypothetical protein